MCKEQQSRHSTSSRVVLFYLYTLWSITHTYVIQLTPLRAFQWPITVHEEPKLPILFLTIYMYKFYRLYFPNYYPIVTHPVNFPCRRKRENVGKTHDFPQSIDKLFSREIRCSLPEARTYDLSGGRRSLRRLRQSLAYRSPEKMHTEKCNLFVKYHAHARNHPVWL